MRKKNKMKKNIFFVVVLILVLSLRCLRSETSIVNVRLCTAVSDKNCAADKTTFSTDIAKLFCSFNILQNTTYENVTVSWFYMGDQRVLVKDTLIKFSDSLKMKKNIISLEKPVNGWPKGVYEVRISIDNGSSPVIKSFLMHDLKEYK